jgi:hypothetical protein
MCKSDHLFGRIPPNLVCSASDDIQNSDKIRSLLKDIREVRQAKSREGLQKIDHSELSVGDSIRLVRHAHSSRPTGAEPMLYGNQ